jgi:hypothetical protein
MHYFLSSKENLCIDFFNKCMISFVANVKLFFCFCFPFHYYYPEILSMKSNLACLRTRHTCEYTVYLWPKVSSLNLHLFSHTKIILYFILLETSTLNLEATVLFVITHLGIPKSNLAYTVRHAILTTENFAPQSRYIGSYEE